MGSELRQKEDGEFDLHKEGGHSEFRILHHKDNTGAEIQTSLIEAVKQHPNITVLTDHYAVESLPSITRESSLPATPPASSATVPMC